MDGVIQMGDIKKVGKIGWKTVAYFLVTTAIACVIGLVIASAFKGSFPMLQLAEGAEYEAKSGDAADHLHRADLRLRRSGRRRKGQALR